MRRFYGLYVYLALYIQALYIHCIYTVYTYLLSQIHVYQILKPLLPAKRPTDALIVIAESARRDHVAHTRMSPVRSSHVQGLHRRLLQAMLVLSQQSLSLLYPATPH